MNFLSDLFLIDCLVWICSSVVITLAFVFFVSFHFYRTNLQVNQKAQLLQQVTVKSYYTEVLTIVFISEIISQNKALSGS